MKIIIDVAEDVELAECEKKELMDFLKKKLCFKVFSVEQLTGLKDELRTDILNRYDNAEYWDSSLIELRGGINETGYGKFDEGGDINGNNS